MKILDNVSKKKDFVFRDNLELLQHALWLYEIKKESLQKVAETLKVNPDTLYYQLKRHGLSVGGDVLDKEANFKRDKPCTCGFCKKGS